MSYATDRLILYNKNGAHLGDLDTSRLTAPPRMVEEVNGVHSLTIYTTERLIPGTRVLWQDGMGYWHEWVVSEPTERHQEGEYYCDWSLQHDLSLVGGTIRWAAAEPGTHDPIDARTAMEIALADQTRWRLGTVEITTTAGASLYHKSAWEYVKLVRSLWGGELSATIEVDHTGVVSRTVNLLEHVGTTEPSRRFDWGEDVSEIVRTPSPAPYYCRVRPYGGQVKTDADGVDYADDCVTIEDVSPNGHDYIQDNEVVDLFKIKNPDGTYEYPTIDVLYDVTLTSSGYDDEELYNKAVAEYTKYTRPKVTYNATVLQYARAGLDYQGVAEGDEIQIVDRGFDADTPLRLQERVIRIEQDLPVFGGNPDNTQLTIGTPERSVVDTLRSIAATVNASIAQRVSEIQGGGAIVYLKDLIEQLNAEINATGGWFYAVPGIGARTYDHSVSDPSVGSEASQVVEIRGGAIRIADSRKQDGDWDWKTVFVSGHVASELITTVNIVAGMITSADGHSVVIDLDNNEFRFGDKDIDYVLSGIEASITGNETQWIQTSSQTVPPSQDAQGWSTTPPAYQKGMYIWERTVITHGDGDVTRTDPVMISGADGQDGAPGAPGKSVTVSKIEYGTSTSPDATPTSWSTTEPTAIAKGTWLWVKTTYSDNTTTTAKSYVGTDGKDGKSVSIQNTDKRDGVTTVTLIDGSGNPITLTINDGDDGPTGQQGPKGADGKSSYIHVAWATSADGTQGFSTTESANKTYIGVYHDQTEDDSTRPADYSWSLIKGADGAAGLNQATIMLYQRSETKPDKPNAATTYTFATKTLTGDYSPWSTEIPDVDGNPCWVTAATASSNTATDTIAKTEWADVTKLVEDGGEGAAGLNQATIYLYCRCGEWRYVGESLVARGVTPFAYDADTETVSFPFTADGESVILPSLAPVRPTASTVYTFATGELTPIPSGWSRTIPDGNGTVWVISAVAISNEATDTIAPSEWSEISKLAEDGTSMAVGVIQYAIGASGTEAPVTGWQDAIPDTSPGQWLWVRTTYSDGTTSDTCTYMGTDGLDGTSVSIQSTEKHDGITTLVFTDSDGSTKTLVINDGSDGPKGTPGANGYVHVAWATSADGSQGFSTSASANKTYIGVYTDHTEADSQDYHDYSWSLIKGADGKSITVSETATSYASSTSGTVIPNNGWQSEVPTVEPGDYLWTRVTVKYSDGNTATSHSAARQGADGRNGTSPTVKNTVTEYQQSTSGTLTPSGEWSTTPPAATAGQYMWTRVTVTYSDNAKAISYSVAYNGKDGIAAYTYSINSSPAALVRAESGTLSPAQITFSATRAQGTGNPSAYSGRFVISEYDGTAWADKYTSSANESSKSYSPTTTARIVRCNLYLAGGTTTLLDTQTAPIVSNGATGAKGAKGDKGDSGLNHATVYLYKRTDGWTYDSETESLTAPHGVMTVDGETVSFPHEVDGESVILAESPAPAKPSTTTTYTFATAALSGDLQGWSRTIPDGGGTVWVTTADAVSSEATVAIEAASWATPSRLATSGTAGIGVAGIEVTYGSSNNPDVTPTSWRVTPPFLMPGEWLWVRTVYTYTDGNETSSMTKSYVGTDGKDGKSVYVKSSEKEDGTTTIVLVDGDGNESTLVINDGSDGPKGTPGKNGYVHTAWANSADGSQGFSTSDSVDKKYLGVYSDDNEDDSTRPADYSWSLIKGDKGDQGNKGDNGADAYTVLLTNESHTFAASTAAAVAGSATSQVIAYKGATQMAATIGTITGQPTGMTVTISDNGTKTSGFTVTVTTSLTTRQGVLTIPVTVDGKSFTLKFSWALALTGAQGVKGDNGLNQATVYLYQRTGIWTYDSATESLIAPPGAITVDGETVSFRFTADGENIIIADMPAPAKPTASTTYTFATSKLSGSFAPWSQEIPDGEGTLWVTTACASSNTATGTIAASDWVTPSRMSVSGKPGMGITRTVISYGVSTSSATKPTSWADEMPYIIPGQWMWIRTTYTYTDGSTDTAYSQSYMGTDGEDGIGVIVQDVTRVGKQITVTMLDSTGQTTSFTVNDGEVGTPGANGYIHIAWATSADGSQGFSTSDSTGKTYMGVYTDDKESDSQLYTKYTWTLIKGATGATGKGISASVPEYYLSTSKTTCTGGSWSTTPQEYVSGRYYWTRDKITWTDGNTTTTTAVLDNGLNGAYEAAANAAKVATNYTTFSEQTGLDVGYTGTSAKTRISGSGVEIIDGSTVSQAMFGSTVRLGRSDKSHMSVSSTGLEMFDSSLNSVLFAGLSGSTSIVRVGEASSGNVVLNGSGYVDVRNASTILAHFGYGRVHKQSGISSNMVTAPYYTLGVRKTDSEIGQYSVAEGYNITASGGCAHAEGSGTEAVGQYSHAEGSGCKTTGYGAYAHAEGSDTLAGGSAYTSGLASQHAEGVSTKATGDASHAEGAYTEASGKYSHAGGLGTKASGDSQTAIGSYNVEDTTSVLIVGCSSDYRYPRNALTLNWSGNLWIYGSLTQNSDRRLKEHIAYLGEDAVEFVRALMPALFVKNGERHTGFYAQDVQEAEPNEWDTSTVKPEHSDESLDFDPLTLDYTALIAPLVAYTQALERRIDEQQQTIEELIGRIEALEERM